MLLELLGIPIYQVMLLDFGAQVQMVLSFVLITWVPLEQALPNAVEHLRMK
jgi:hypothetical protein